MAADGEDPLGKIGAVVGHSFRMPRSDENAYTMAANAVWRLNLQYDIGLECHRFEMA